MEKDKSIVLKSNQTPVFSAENNLTIADILSVAVSEAETKLQKVLKEGMTEVRRIEGKIKQIGKDLDIQIDVLQKECGLQEEIEIANKYLNKLFEITITISTEIDTKKKVVNYQYGIMHSHGHRKVPFNSEILRLSDLLASEEDGLEQARADVAETRKRLANIPALERRYRGKLVANQLGKTTEGKDVLKVITANMEEELRNI